MSDLSLHLFGSPTLEINGNPVHIPRRKATALLAYLAVSGKSHSRDVLATLLWPENDQSSARAELRRTLSVLNRTSDDSDFWDDLMEKGSQALEDYRLSGEAKAAIISGDLKWINKNIGELTQKQLMFIYKRLEREAW